MVPHATQRIEERRSSSNHAHFSRTNPNQTFKFPELNDDEYTNEALDDFSREGSPRPLPNGLPQGLHSSERWPARRASNAGSWNSWANGKEHKGRHGRQKSLNEAIKTARTRKMSISETGHEIAESLKAPVSWKLILLCGFWYSTSILTNTSSNAVTTTQMFGFPLTFIGLYLYDRTHDSSKADKRARAMGEAKEPLLPINVSDAKKHDPAPPMYTQSPAAVEDLGRHFAGASGYANGDPVGSGPGRPRSGSGTGVGRTRAGSRPSPAPMMPYSLPPGTKAEETWRQEDVSNTPQGIGVR